MKSRLVAAVLLVLSACGKRTGLPESSNRPYEVVVADSGGLLAGMLKQPYGGLPQTEPSFDVVLLNTRSPGGMYRYARSIVIYRPGIPIRVEHNLYARPQLVIHTDGSAPERVRNELCRFETACRMADIKERRNGRAEKMMARRFGIAMWVPADMEVVMDTDNFVWAMSETSRATLGIGVFRLADTTHVAEHIDSIMRKNLKGETDDMYVQTVHGTLVGRLSADRALWVRGLWQMENDAMGGPMVMRAIRKDGSWVAAVALVYAPAMKKRNLVAGLETVLQTMN